jgi:hypothetical protein
VEVLRNMVIYDLGDMMIVQHDVRLARKNLAKGMQTRKVDAYGLEVDTGFAIVVVVVVVVVVANVTWVVGLATVTVLHWIR